MILSAHTDIEQGKLIHTLTKHESRNSKLKKIDEEESWVEVSLSTSKTKHPF